MIDCSVFKLKHPIVYIPFHSLKDAPKDFVENLKSKFPILVRKNWIKYSPNLEKYMYKLNKNKKTIKTIPYLFVNYTKVKNCINLDYSKYISSPLGQNIFEWFVEHPILNELNKEFHNGVPLEIQIKRWKAGEEWDRRKYNNEDYFVIYPCELYYFHLFHVIKKKDYNNFTKYSSSDDQLDEDTKKIDYIGDPEPSLDETSHITNYEIQTTNTNNHTTSSYEIILLIIGIIFIILFLFKK